MPNHTAFQVIFDKAETLSVQRRHVVAQSTTRGGIVRSVSRGAQPKKFTVTLASGMPWDMMRPYIKLIDEADRYQVGDVTINANGLQPWLGTDAEGGFYGNTYSVTCTVMPDWTINARNQVSWSGPFVFTEYIA